MDAIWGITPNFCEWDYLHQIVDRLDIDGRIAVVAIGEKSWRHSPPPIPPIIGDDVTVLVISDERYTALPWCNQVRAVFKSYIRQQVGNLYPLPLGYVSGFLQQEPRPNSERQYDVLFIGAKRRNRPIIVPKHLNSRIEWTKRFRDGYDVPTYSSFMYDTKVALCPPGGKSPESFRIFEAARAGCVLITPPLPRHELYATCPAIQIEWTGKNVCNALAICDDVARLAHLQEQTVAWWQTVCSEEAVAYKISVRR